MDKQFLVEQLIGQLSNTAQIALRASEAAAVEARDGATPQEKREDARVALEQGRMSKAQSDRARRALAEVDALRAFKPTAMSSKAAIAIGAIVEIEDAETGDGKTFFLAPVGAGVSLTGPGGDGHLSVVTPASPIGRAVLGKQVGAVVDVTVEGELREWSISWVG